MSDSIDKIYEAALYSKKYETIDLGSISDSTVLKVKKITGIDLTGFKIFVDTYSIVHVLKGHGNPIKEAEQGQIAVTKEDFGKVVSIINNPDKIMRGNTANTIKFIKKIKNKYFIIEEIRYKNPAKGKLEDKLSLKTMYIKKA